MLSEILCDRFVDEGHPRGVISFDAGLNIVMGSKGGSNSIGKTTFLLAVDFAFGGKMYAEQKDILKNAGPHLLCFAHKVDGVEHRFSRPIENCSVVYRCDKGYEPIESIGLDGFNAWLLKAYRLDFSGLSFRNAVGPFLRVYGKDNLNEKKPLMSHSAEAMQASIDRVVGLFGEHASISVLEKAEKEAKSSLRLFGSAMDKEFIVGAKNQAEVRENEIRIAELEARLKEMEASSERGFFDLDEFRIEETAMQKSRRDMLKRRRGKLMAQQRRMNEEGVFAEFAKNGDIKRLEEFFPTVAVKRIEEIEGFHSKLSNILRKERNEERLRIDNQISAIDAEIESLEKELSEVDGMARLPSSILKKYAEIASEMRTLERANGAYREKAALRRQSSEASEKLKEGVDRALRSVEAQVNRHLEVLNSRVAGPDKTPPVLSLENAKKYSFGILGDTGTGANVRAMELLDLTLLDLTALPAVACDSSALKQLADDVLLRLLEEFSHRSKQSFIAIDKAESFADGSIPKFIEDSTVIRLSDGHELFGRSWAKATDGSV